MGLQTSKQFRDQLQFALGNRGFDETQLGYWLNVGLQDLVGREQFEDLIEPLVALVTSGDNVLNISLPDPGGDTPLEGIIEISNETDDIMLTKIDKARYNLLEPEVMGEPQHWYREGLQILVWPWPQTDTTFAGQVLIPHPALEGDATTTILLRAFDRSIHLLSMFHALTDLEEPNRAAYFMQAAERYTNRVTTRDDIEGRATPEPLQPIELRSQLQRQRSVSTRVR